MLAGPFTDPFYRRFTTPKCESMVVGSSRAAQGIIPEILHSQWAEYGESVPPIYNYSFTIKSTPYGAPYTASILRKLNRTSRASNRLFILEVNPWSLSDLFLTAHPSDPFTEAAFAPNNMDFVDWDPNPEYIFKNVDNRLLVITRHFFHHAHPILQADGSLEITIKRSESELMAAIKEKQVEYQNFAKRSNLSQIRLTHLSNLIDSLSGYGKCVLVRLPVHPLIGQIEEDFFEEFDPQMEEMVVRQKVSYINLKDFNNKIETTDGNHLSRASAIEISKYLAKEIKSYHAN